MSKEFFDDNFESSDADNSWLDEWNAEQKLNPVDAHEMLRRSFAERLAEWRQNHPGESSWVIAFYYNHEDNEDVFDTKGALWIPPEHIQNIINRVGAYIHMSAMLEMESELFGTGIQTNHQPPTIMNLDTDVPCVYVNPQFSMVLRHSEQIERDFGVVINSNIT